MKTERCQDNIKEAEQILSSTKDIIGYCKFVKIYNIFRDMDEGSQVSTLCYLHNEYFTEEQKLIFSRLLHTT